MAISPKDAKDLTQEEKDDVKKQEARIDDYLRKHYQGVQLTVTINGTSRVKSHIIKLYQQSGWTVTLNNSRDSSGAEYLFSETQHSYDYYNR